MVKRSFTDALTAIVGRMSDSFKGVQYIEPEEYFRRNTASDKPKGYNQFPQYIKDWLYETYGDKGDCVVMKSPLHPFYQIDPIMLRQAPQLVEMHLDAIMIDSMDVFEVKPRFEVEHDPCYIQLIVSCFIITPVGNVVGVRNLRHPQIGGVLSIPQGHVEPVTNFANRTLRSVMDENMSRELNEELEFMLDEQPQSFNQVKRKFTGVGYYPAKSPGHVFAFYTIDMRDTNLDLPLNIRGREDFNMIEIYALDELPSDNSLGDFLFDQYWGYKIESMIETYERNPGIIGW